MVMPARGVRNNNPLNIRLNDIDYVGEIKSSDPDFKQFDKPEDGIRAGAVILLAYYDLHDIDTVAEIIARWAPTIENDTSAYAASVSTDTGYGLNEELTMYDAVTLFRLVKAMIKVENGGNPYPDTTIQTGVNLAL